MNKEFNRMQKLAGLLTENMEGKNLDSIADEAYAHFNTLSTSDSASRRDYIESLGLDDDDVKMVMMKVTDMMRYGMDEGDKMGMEEGLKRTIRESQKKKALREKLREMILAEMDEAKKAEDDEDDVEIEDIDVSDDEMRGGDNPDIDKIQDLLEQLQNAAEDLGDEKLLTQIGNIITFFTRQHVANADDNMG